MTGKISDDATADPTVAVTDAMCFAAEVAGVNKGPTGAALATYLLAKAGTLANKVISGASNTISNLTTAMFAANVIDTDGTLAANSDTRIASQKAVKTYADALIAANDAMVFKGVTDCSGNPNYPAADRGHTYRVSVAGKIGGASGIAVEVGDMFICLTDGTASGNQATVGTAWSIIQTNIDGAVVGPASSTAGEFAFFNGATGKALIGLGVIYSDLSKLANNRVINPSGQINQTGAGTAANATYWFDQWVHLNQSNPVTPSQLLNAENGTPFMIRTTQSNAAAQRFGVLQPIEGANCIDLRGQNVTLSARVQMSAATTLRYAIIEWTGTADTPVIDVVNSWTNATFTTGNFFKATTTTIAATGSTALAANTLTSIALTGTVSGSANNLLVFFWTDSTQAQNVTFDIGKVKLELGGVASAYVPRDPVAELQVCQRYLTVFGPGASSAGFIAGGMLSGTQGYYPIRFWNPMRVTPSSITVSAASDWTNNPLVSGASSAAGTAAQFASTSPYGFRLGLTSLTTGAPSGAFSELLTSNTSAKIIAKAQM